MSYYASNQPYNSAHKQKDGNANGAILGGLAGVGLAGAAHKFGGKAISGMQEGVKSKLRASQNNMEATMNRENVSSSDSIGAQRSHYKNVSKGTKAMKGLSDASKLQGKAFGGGWKGKALAYGGSALLGMGTGATMDAMNK